MVSKLLETTPEGLYCPAGGFHIDPWRPVERAAVTHAHSDHARAGCSRYLCVADGELMLRHRLGKDIQLKTLLFGEILEHNGVKVSFHPAGHVAGSSQIRLEKDGEVLVVSGDYKVEADPTCRAFEPVRCHTFVTESTFGLPIYRWEPSQQVFDRVNAWWRANKDAGRTSILLGYALGKAQRLIAGVDPSIGPIHLHGAVEEMTNVYRQAGIAMPPTQSATNMPRGHKWAGSLIVAPPSADGTPWARKFEPASVGYASGWMRVRGMRRRRSVDRGFVLSDHADWPGLNQAIRATGAENILVTHGPSEILSRWLREQGLNAQPLATAFRGETEDAGEAA